jgi:hypothetical protein
MRAAAVVKARTFAADLVVPQYERLYEEMLGR